jgi:hypothetical protein
MEDCILLVCSRKLKDDTPLVTDSNGEDNDVSSSHTIHALLDPLHYTVIGTLWMVIESIVRIFFIY